VILASGEKKLLALDSTTRVDRAFCSIEHTGNLAVTTIGEDDPLGSQTRLRRLTGHGLRNALGLESIFHSRGRHSSKRSFKGHGKSEVFIFDIPSGLASAPNIKMKDATLRVPLPMLPWAGFFACAFPNAPVVLSYLSPITYLTERPKCAPAPGVGESIHERIGLTPWTISGRRMGLA
jgi:hypothetical protein